MARVSSWLWIALACCAAPAFASADAPTPAPLSPPPPPPPDASVHVPAGYDAPPPVPYPSATAPTPFAAAATPNADGGFRLPTRLATRMRLLDQNLSVIGQQPSALSRGIVSTIIGGLGITAGALLYDESDPTLAIYLLTLGGVTLATGIVDLAVLPNPSNATREFSTMPMRTRDEARARLRAGEQVFEELAFRYRLARYLTASLNTAAGTIMLPIYLIQRDGELSGGFDALIIIGAAMSVLNGVIAFLSPTDIERRYSEYQDVVEAQREERRRERGTRVTGSVTPLPGGAGATLRATF